MVQRPSAGDYIANITTQVPRMISGISELAKAEIKPSVKHAGIGGGMLSAAAVVGLSVLRLLMIASAFACAIFFHYVLNFNVLAAITFGFLTMGILGLVIAGIFALMGKGQLGKVKAPQAAIAETKASLAALSNSISAGVTDAKLGVVDRQGVSSTDLQSRTAGATEGRHAADPTI